MGISKGRVYLDGSTVALHGTIHILHLLQSVAHVAVCVSKVGVDPMGGEKVGVSDWKRKENGMQSNAFPPQYPQHNNTHPPTHSPDSLLVVHESVLQFPLHLQDARQVGVGCRKLWHDLRRNREGGRRGRGGNAALLFANICVSSSSLKPYPPHITAHTVTISTQPPGWLTECSLPYL